MKETRITGINGWLLVYIIGSIPLLIIYSMGLSGWFFDYPFALMVAIFVVLASPLALIFLKSPKAPKWNIAVWWIVVALMTARSISVFLEPGSGEGMSREEMTTVALTLLGIVSVALGWAIVWTRYFKESTRVHSTFG